MAELLKVQGIRKAYPGVVAVNDLSFTLNEGEVLAILGENGAGKSTTMKMISGVERPDKGHIYIDGESCQFANPHEATAAGVGIVFQELALVDELSVAENIFMNRQPTKKGFNIDFDQLASDTKEMLDLFDLKIDPMTQLSMLASGNRQIIEILKAISMNPRILILDEPTSSLSESEIEKLFRVIESLKAKGMSFIYVSHKLNEIFTICDQAVVMRDGQFIAKEAVANLTEEKIISLMVGREIKDLFGKDIVGRVKSTELFRIERFKREMDTSFVDFHIKKGEILGLYGLVGAGRTELAEAIVGFRSKAEGRVLINGQAVTINNPRHAKKAGIGYITEDRKALGLYLDKSIQQNLVVNNLSGFSDAGILRESRMDDFAESCLERYSVAAHSRHQYVEKLSGGNQQKILIAMWLEQDPKMMIFDEPTRGVDIGAKSEIYSLIREYTSKENGALVISSEITELMGLCDRIMVMRENAIVGEINKEDFSEEAIVGHATGVNQIRS